MSTESQQSRVLLQLRDMILKGEFEPGERLAEIPLAERLGGSRTPVRLALTTLEHEGLIEASPGGGYKMRSFTAKDVVDAIQARGALEGYAARLLAERGAPRHVLRSLHDCLARGDAAVDKPAMGLDDYATYAEANDRFHGLLIMGSDNLALGRLMAMLDGQPFAAASSLLPMQSSMAEGHEWMKIAQRQHHAIVEAIERGQGLRVQGLCEEHVLIAQRNLEYALERPDVAAAVMPGIRLMSGPDRA